jgi:hypothetical protein
MRVSRVLLGAPLLTRASPHLFFLRQGVVVAVGVFKRRFFLLDSCAALLLFRNVIIMTTSSSEAEASLSEQHYLESFLSVQLPKLGLDYDTYGPYVVGVFTVGESSNTDAAFDEEELDSVLELLRASSDDHHDDVSWEQLKRDVIAKHEEYTREFQKVQEKQRHEAQLREQERLRHDIEIARTMPVEKKKRVAEMNEQKRALVERFAYEELQEEEAEEESEADIVVSNKHVAHEANATKTTTKESRSSAQKTKTTMTTKREEQAATKQQKLLKMKAKEERRKRATKSERRR